MAISNRWISHVFLCLLLPLFVSASNGIAKENLCDDNSDIRTSQYMTYYGCYNLSCFAPKTLSTVIGIDQCTDQCKNGSHSYAALFHGYLCLCGKLICGRADTVCDSKCGLPCNATADILQTCGGKYYFQVYRGESSDETSDENYGFHSIQVVAVVCGVIAVAACLTCYVSGRYGRRCKRRRDRHQAESPTIPTELTSRRQRPRSRDNIYNIAGHNQHHPVSITNGHSVSSLSLLLENAYDHTSASGRIQNTSNPHRGFNSLPRRLPSQPALSLQNPSGLEKVTEGEELRKKDECRGFCCSDSKCDPECSCRGRRVPGRPESDRRIPRKKPDSRGMFVAWSEMNALDGAVEDNRARQIGKGTSDVSKVSVREMGRGPRRDVSHGRSLKDRGEMLASPYEERGMFALPHEKETKENQHSRKNERLASQINNGRPPVTLRITKPEDEIKNDSGAYYHTLETENEYSSKETLMREIFDAKPSTSTDYFTLEQSDYSGEPSDITFSTEQNDDHRDFDGTPSCSVSTDPQYDYAAIPGLSNLRNLP